METIKRKDGTRYRESYYLAGKKINSPYFHKITDARAWKRRSEIEKFSKMAYGEFYVEKRDINFKEYAQEWFDTNIKGTCSHKTILNYESVLRVHLYPRFANLKLAEFKEEHGRKLLKELLKDKSPKGIAYVWGVLRTILTKARKEKIILHYPFENIQLPRENLKEDNYWGKLEVNQFLSSNSADQLYPFYYTAIHSGLRLAELCGLRWDRIDFQNNQLSVTRTRDKQGLRDTTKSKLKRVVPMTIEVKVMLLKLFKARGQNPFVFLEENGSELDYGHIYRKFRKAQDRASISRKIRFHDLRHTFASNFMMNGGNLYDLQRLLGHSDSKMTMRYAHLSPEHFQSSIKFMQIASSESIPDLDLKEVFGSENVSLLITGTV